MRQIQFPDRYLPSIEAGLKTLGYSLEQPEPLARAIQKLSTFYIEFPESQTPWRERWCKAAYIAYFFPLNYVRARAVVWEGERLGFFDDLCSLIDFGSGLGTIPLLLDDAMGGVFRDITAIESREEAGKLFAFLRSSESPQVFWTKDFRGQIQTEKRSKTLSSFSFSLTEIERIPEWAMASEALMILEPATHQDARCLQSMRESLMEKGFHLWAPCTHQQPCPLLTHSKRDWCHDRVIWEMPDFMARISEYLPMRNPTLTVSYLLARKKAPPQWLSELSRLTGDLKKEKGLSRQMVCRGSQREFLSWQKRDGEAPAWPKGALVRIAPNAKVKNTEIRPLPHEAHLIVGDQLMEPPSPTRAP